MPEAPAAGSTGTETEQGQQSGTEGQPATGTEGQPAGGQGGTPGDDAGRGGKDAILADLARERDARQAAEKAQTDFLDGLKKLIGGDSSELTPEQLQTELATAQASAEGSALELALYRAGAGAVNVDAILDSRSAREALKGVKPSDATALAAKIEEFKKDPRFALVPPGQGAGDAGSGGKPPVASMNDWIRQAASS